ncbi:MAG: methyltransferase [Candidatus Hinthialibacter antarcticus]|nr:methyltransferase [Candidatus Hinthialibacter antarcticus]
MTLNPQKIEELANGYKNAQVLFTALRLRLFETIGRDVCSLEELNPRLKTDVRGLRILCDALCGIGLLEKNAKGYRNSEAALDVLLTGSPNSKAAMMLNGARLYETWGRLYDAVKLGTPAPENEIDPRLKRNELAFARAMADIARMSAAETAVALPLHDVKRLLDLGGGPGLYAIECARANAELHAVVFDTEETLVVTRENITKAGLEDRVSTQAGDALNDGLGGGYDLILISNFLHIFSPEQNQKTLQRCAAALNPGGYVAVKDFLLDEDRTGPEWMTQFAVNMLVNTDGGDCYTRTEYLAWLVTAGFSLVSESPVGCNSTVLVGKRK